MSAAGIWTIALVGTLVAGIAYGWLSVASDGLRNAVRDRRLHRRERRVTAAAWDAALTDPDFEPDRIRRDVVALVALVEQPATASTPTARGWTPELGVVVRVRWRAVGARARSSRWTSAGCWAGATAAGCCNEAELRHAGLTELAAADGRWPRRPATCCAWTTTAGACSTMRATGPPEDPWKLVASADA